MDSSKICEIISDKTFPVVAGLSVLELGPFNGHFTEHLLRYTPYTTVVELDPAAISALEKKFKNIKIIKEDIFESLHTVGKFDAVVLYGVLYHSPSPLKVLEDIANYIQPKYILLENTMGKHSADRIAIHHEEPNFAGMRQSTRKTCKLVMTLGQDYFDTAMKNLEYTQVDSFYVPDEFSVDNLKHNSYYTIWKLNEITNIR